MKNITKSLNQVKKEFKEWIKTIGLFEDEKIADLYVYAITDKYVITTITISKKSHTVYKTMFYRKFDEKTFEFVTILDVM